MKGRPGQPGRPRLDVRMTIREQKARLRHEIAAAICLLRPGYLCEAGGAISEKLAAMGEYRAARTILAFASTDTEPDIRPFLLGVLQDGKRLVLPACTAADAMEYRTVTDLDALRPGRYGILEPPEGSSVVQPAEIGFAVLPCVTCDRSGRRLGHGGGYYDRFLTDYKGTAVIVCPEMLLREDIPMVNWDQAVPIVVTERTIYRGGMESNF